MRHHKTGWIPKSWREKTGNVNNRLSHLKQIKILWYFLSLQSAWKLSLTNSLTTKIHHVSFKSTPFKVLISNECLWMPPGIFEYEKHGKTSPTYFLQKCFEPNRNANRVSDPSNTSPLQTSRGPWHFSHCKGHKASRNWLKRRAWPPSNFLGILMGSNPFELPFFFSK